MNEFNSYINFVPGAVLPDNKLSEDLWFIYCDNKLMVKVAEDTISIPNWAEVSALHPNFSRIHFLGSLRSVNCYCADLPSNSSIPSGMELRELRPVAFSLSEELFVTAGKAIQVLTWDQAHQFCGKCGSKMEPMAVERAKQCPECGLINYPRLSPAIIVAVIKENKILLAHNSRFANNMYSVLAGFVEPGETFEDCVKREVFEEVGIQVKNIKYFGSQPWPFPNSLMIGFTAEYAGGEINVDGVEIDKADWFTVDTLPNGPSKISIAGKLLGWFVENNK